MMEILLVIAIAVLLAGSVYVAADEWRRNLESGSARTATPILFPALAIEFTTSLSHLSLAATTGLTLVSVPFLALIVISQGSTQTADAEKTSIISSSLLFVLVLAAVTYFIRTGTGAVVPLAVGFVGGALLMIIPDKLSSLLNAPSVGNER